MRNGRKIHSLYSFTFTAVIVIHEYIYSHSTTKFAFKKYICLKLTTYFFFRNIFTHIYGMYRSHSTDHIRSHSRSKYSVNTVQYPFNIFCVIPFRIFKSKLRLFLNANGRRRKAHWGGRPKTSNTTVKLARSFFLQFFISYKSANGNGTLRK